MSSANHDNRPRRNLRSMVIEPFKQIKFGVYVIGVSVAFLGVCAYMFVEAFTEQYRHVMAIFNVVDPTKRWELVTNDVFRTNAIRIGALFVLYIVTLFTMVFRLTHRYYGPLVSIERFIEHFANGDYRRRAKIRDKDELHGLVTKLNHMADQIQARHGVGPGADLNQTPDQFDENGDDNKAAS